MSSTIEGLANYGEPASAWTIRQRRWLHRLVLGALWLVLGLVVLDGLDVVEVVGPDEAVVRAAGAGYELEVEHPSTSRPALASLLRIRIEQEGGFDEPLQIGITRHYLEAWDVNGILPAPSAETAVGPWIIWEFDPPPGEELVITYEARFEPGLQADRAGAVAVFEEDEPVLRVDWTTRIRP